MSAPPAQPAGRKWPAQKEPSLTEEIFSISSIVTSVPKVSAVKLEAQATTQRLRSAHSIISAPTAQKRARFPFVLQAHTLPTQQPSLMLIALSALQENSVMVLIVLVLPQQDLKIV